MRRLWKILLALAFLLVLTYILRPYSLIIDNAYTSIGQRVKQTWDTVTSPIREYEAVRHALTVGSSNAIMLKLLTGIGNKTKEKLTNGFNSLLNRKTKQTENRITDLLNNHLPHIKNRIATLEKESKLQGEIIDKLKQLHQEEKQVLDGENERLQSLVESQKGMIEKLRNENDNLQTILDEKRRGK